jgi:hypothetical protein
MPQKLCKDCPFWQPGREPKVDEVPISVREPHCCYWPRKQQRYGTDYVCALFRLLPNLPRMYAYES